MIHASAAFFLFVYLLRGLLRAASSVLCFCSLGHFWIFFIMLPSPPPTPRHTLRRDVICSAGDSDIRRHHSERARLTRAAASCFYFSANITPLYFHSSCGRVEECAWSFLGLKDPDVARVSDEGGEVSSSSEKPASTPTDTQVRVLLIDPAS